MLYGIIDMGSNSVRLSIFRAENGVITQVIGKKVMAGLAGYVKKGRLTQAGIERACMALEALREILDNFNVDGAGIFATASLRNICNQDEVLNQMERVTGITPEIITGKEELEREYGEIKARGLAHVMPQSELTAESLPPAIDALWADRELLRQRLAALPDADGTQLVLDQIHKYMKK